jgi:hypothetical protein
MGVHLWIATIFFFNCRPSFAYSSTCDNPTFRKTTLIENQVAYTRYLVENLAAHKNYKVDNEKYRVTCKKYQLEIQGS